MIYPKIRNLVFLLVLVACSAGVPISSGTTGNATVSGAGEPLLTGADQTGAYLRLLRGKKVGVVANQTSLVGSRHLVDLLIDSGITVSRVFAPEHGFRGEAGPGDHVKSGIDSKTGIALVSLYGSHKKPTKEDLEGVDVIVFDIQDVGARFYTYISTLHYVMESCAAFNIPVIVLDRPNPNGFYIDGPVLDTAFRSFVGIAPIPVVHGLTVGEYAKMAKGEKWISDAAKCTLLVVPMVGYTHKTLYNLPIRPSPNLPNMDAIYLYPSLCFFEGAKVSVGRGTEFPFQIMGFPGYKNGDYEFKPVEISGVIKDPPFENQVCKGVKLNAKKELVLKSGQLQIEWIIQMYKAYTDSSSFFIPFFDKLAGTDMLRKQIQANMSVEEIRKSWQPGLNSYLTKRKKYLLYED
ncbi:MAG: DUF1343 domain-containing protein [Bacteroidetes bacterium]|nr:DUF1343 domain-containing protein [Bacteroidota bacterium]